MTSFQALILLLALLGTAEPQESCQAQVVVTTAAELREQLTTVVHSMGDRNATLANIPTQQLATDSQILTRIEDKLDAVNQSMENINRKLDSLEKQMNQLHGLGLSTNNAASSCSEILQTNPASPSGYYWVTNSAGHLLKVYCDMTRSCGGVTGGWMRVAYLDMTNSSHHCPGGLRQRIDSNFRTCTVYYSEHGGCSSAQYRSHGIPYSKVCGKIKAYSDKTVDGFVTHSSRRGHTINSNYVDGVSLTRGTPTRQHIWSFAAAHQCPCSNVPTFVGNDYFCDGAGGAWSTLNLSYPLWDGENCASVCCRRNNLPWFYKQLPSTTADNIEMRVCRDQGREDEDIAIENLEMYVQ